MSGSLCCRLSRSSVFLTTTRIAWPSSTRDVIASRPGAGVFLRLHLTYAGTHLALHDPAPTHTYTAYTRAMAALMAFRNKDEALEELVTSEERYVKALKTFRNVSTYTMDGEVPR